MPGRAAPAGAGAWLLVTGTVLELTVRVLPFPLPHAHGGDVLIKVSAHEWVSGPELVRAQVVTAVNGRLVLVARWESPELSSWPERVTPAAAFAIAAMDWLMVWDANLGADVPVRLDVPDDTFAAAAPWVPGAALRM